MNNKSMKNDIKVSICIPIYERKDNLIRLLESCKIQDFNDYEIVISDDSISNAIYDVYCKYKDVFKNIQYSRLTTTNPVVNWNNCIKLSKAKYIKFMFDDDWFSYDYSLRKMYELIDNSNGNFAFCGTKEIWIDNPEKSYERHISEKDLNLISKNPCYLYLGNCVSGPSATIFKRGPLFDENLVWLVDIELYMNILTSNKEFSHSFETLISVGKSHDELTYKCLNDHRLVKKEYLYIYRKYKLYKYIKCVFRLISKLINI